MGWVFRYSIFQWGEVLHRYKSCEDLIGAPRERFGNLGTEMGENKYEILQYLFPREYLASGLINHIIWKSSTLAEIVASIEPNSKLGSY
jgi:hypothetical protein